MTFQSGRCASTSLPSTPRNGMNGTPFSAACNMVCIAGHVASITLTVPRFTASANRGAVPASPSVTALVCTETTHPAPIRRSVANPDTGTPSSCKPRAPRRISARASSQGDNELSGGSASIAPSGIDAANRSSDISIGRTVSPEVAEVNPCSPSLKGERRGF